MKFALPVCYENIFAMQYKISVPPHVETVALLMKPPGALDKTKKREDESSLF